AVAVGLAGPRPTAEPAAALELDVELAVVAAAELRDRAPLARLEAGVARIDAVEHGERDRQHDDVRHHLDRSVAALERRAVAPVRRLREPDQLVAGDHRVAE